MLVDGKQQATNLIPVFGDGKDHTVSVLIG